MRVIRAVDASATSMYRYKFLREISMFHSGGHQLATAVGSKW